MTARTKLSFSLYHMLRGIAFQFLRTVEQRRSVGIVWGTIQRHWRLVLVVLFINLAAAIFEGGTFGLLSVALAVLVQGERADLKNLFGELGVFRALIPPHPDQAFLLLLGLAVVSQIARSTLQFAAQIVTAYMSSQIKIDVTNRTFQQCMKMSFAQISQYSVGDLTSYLSQTNSIVSLINWGSQVIRTTLLSGAYIAVMFWISAPSALVALPLMIILSLGLRTIMSRIYKISNEITRLGVAFSFKTTELILATRVVRTFAREHAAIAQVRDNLVEQAKYILRAQRWQALINPIIETITIIGVSAALISGYLLLGAEGARAIFAKAAVFLLMLYRLVPKFSEMSQYAATLQRMLPDLKRVTSLLRIDDKEYERNDGIPFEGLHEGIEVRNLSFRYREDGPLVLKNISLVIPRGRMVALVGASGAGKSTLADLLLGVYQPTEGQILVDGRDLREFNPKSWRRGLGVVSQTTFIFNATVRENITFARPDASEEEMIAAAKVANAHDFIMETEKGYETLLGNQGYRLSGGQKQRIAIARAIIHNPSILIFDEATSALDSEAERLIQDAIDRLRGERTIIAIAHRLSTIRKADMIFVLHRGQLVESGTHETLVKQHGRYAHLWYLQSE